MMKPPCFKHRAYLNGKTFKRNGVEYTVLEGRMEYMEGVYQPVIVLKSDIEIRTVTEEYFFEKITEFDHYLNPIEI